MFKRLALAVGLCAAISFGGCATSGPLGSGQIVSSTLDEKALITAETGFRGALIAANGAVDAGVLKGPNALKVRDALIKAKAALDVARKAYAIGDAIQLTASISEANGLLAFVAPLIRR